MTFSYPCKSPLSGSLLLLASVVVLSLPSCVGSLPSSRPVCGNCEEPTRFVRLERVKSQVLGDIQPPFTHPFQLNPEEWSKILDSIYVRKINPGFLIMDGGKGSEEPAFTPEAIRYLSLTLPKAFERAQSDEIIVYALTTSSDIPISEISTGGLFLKNEGLHVILANHRYAVSMPGVRELLWDHPLHSQAALYDLVPRPYQIIMKPDDSSINAAPLKLTIDYKDLFRSFMNSSSEPQPVSPGVPSLDSQKRPEQPIEDRLEILKHLKERDLITEDEFQTKKHELLDRL